MSTEIIFHEEAREKILKGINKSVDAIRVTIGPKGRNVVIGQVYGTAESTNDGDKIAQSNSPEDAFEKIGADYVKDLTERVNKIGGDGTSTGSILYQSMVKEGMKTIISGTNAIGIKNYMKKAGDEVITFLKDHAKEIVDEADILKVAIISSESEEIGKVVADTAIAVGKDGIINVEEGQVVGLSSEIKKGLEINSGYVSQYMANNAEMTEAEFRNAPVLICDKRLSDIPELVKLGEVLVNAEIPELVLLVEDIEAEPLSVVVRTKMLGGTPKILVVKAPGFGESKKEYLKDIAVITGGKVLSDDTGFDFLKSSSEDILKSLGYAEKVVSKKDTTTFIGGKGQEEDIKSYTDILAKRAEDSKSKYDKENLKKRIAKILGGVGVIKVGVSSEADMSYLKDKLEDAINATQSAMAEGIIAGGGTALVQASKMLLEKIKKEKMSMSHEELVAYQIVANALQEPLKQIMKNAGREDWAVIVDKIENNVGYDANRDELVTDMYIAGIIDPVRVERAGVEVAVSAAGIFLTTEVAIVEKPKKLEDSNY